MAVREKWFTGVVQRTISSVAEVTRSGSRRSFSSSSGCSSSASRPFELPFRVVSWPATMIRK
ncbi:MAG: hypothetical protein QNK03_15745 [Myxococcota bacterium]|nr:hypothetical protein [Myxococcota bacterium]